MSHISSVSRSQLQYRCGLWHQKAFRQASLCIYRLTGSTVYRKCSSCEVENVKYDLYLREITKKKKKTQSIILFSVLLVMQTCWAQCSSARVFTTTLPILWNAKYSFGFQLRNLITGVKKEQKLIHKCWISREPKLLWLDWDVNLQRLK